MKKALLLINLGTPQTLAVNDVRKYLREFLSDPRVIDIHPLARRILLECFILPFRPKRSANAYAKIWSEKGSPLQVYTRELSEGVASRLADHKDIMVGYAMRYQEPSIRSQIDRFVASGVNELVVFPLFPQYSSAAWGSAAEECMKSLSHQWNVPGLKIIPPFFDQADFVSCFASKIQHFLSKDKWEKIVFSYHGLPERHCHKSDTSSSAGYCLKTSNCCKTLNDNNSMCYRAQCFATTRAITNSLGLSENQFFVSFQSRLGRTPWIKPYTDQIISKLAAEGVRSILVVSPSFVADCLETLEEIKIRYREEFLSAGGHRLELVPSLNADPDWIDAVVKISAPELGLC